MGMLGLLPGLLPGLIDVFHGNILEEVGRRDSGCSLNLGIWVVCLWGCWDDRWADGVVHGTILDRDSHRTYCMTVVVP